MAQPTIGRIVYYHAIDSGKIFPAIIVDVIGEDRVDLFVMCSRLGGPMDGRLDEGTFFERNVLQGSQNGRWEWPSRAEGGPA